MVLVAYFVTLETIQVFTTEEYTQVAGQLSNALQATLGDATKIRGYVHTDELSDTRVEVEITQSEPAPSSTITARAVVQTEAPERVGFDKNLFSSAVRVELPFPVKIYKRAVSKDEQLALHG